MQPRLKHATLIQLCALLLVSACLPLQLSALQKGQELYRKTYTLDDCLRIALNGNLDIISAQAELQSAGANITNAFGDFLPSVNFSMGYTRDLDPIKRQIVVQDEIREATANPNSYSMRAAADITVFNGFSREARYNRAQSDFSAVDLTAQHTRSRVALTVRTQFIDIMRNSQILTIRKEDIELAKQELERTKAQYDVGKVAIGTIYAQEAELGTRELDYVRAENELNKSKARLLTSMGLNPSHSAEFLSTGVPTSISTGDIQAFKAGTGSYNTAVGKAMQNRNDFSAANQRVESAESGVTMARSSYFPNISAGVSWTWQDTSLGNFSSGRPFLNLNLSLPIFDNFRTNNQLQGAQVQLQQQLVEQQKVEQSIASDVQEAFLELSAAEKEIEITQRSLKSAEQNFESAQERFRIGAANILDYTTANTQFVNAKINRVNAVYNYLSAQYQVRFAIGLLK